MDDVILALATSGAGALVGAVGTDAWNTARVGISKLFSRRNSRAIRIIESRLDDLEQLTDSDGADVQRERARQASMWAGRLEDLLDEHPDAVGDLEQLISEIALRLPRESSVRNAQTVRASGQSQVWAVTHGNLHVHHAQPPTKEHLRVPAEIHFFELGCAVGTGLAVLPIGETRNDSAFQGFLDELRETGATVAEIDHFRDLKRIINDPNSSRQCVRNAVEGYAKAIQEAMSSARRRAIGDEFRWFRVGHLLYGIAIQQFPPDGDNDCRAERRALAAVAHSITVPSNIRDEITNFASNTSASPAASLRAANEIAQMCRAYL
jgi:hypothetical protein